MKSRCMTLSLLHILGKRWTVPLIEIIYPSRGMQFNQIQRSLKGITAKSLSSILNELSEATLIKRTESKDSNVLSTSYSLTGKGREVVGFIRSAKRLGINIYGIDATCMGRKCSECSLNAPLS